MKTDDTKFLKTILDAQDLTAVTTMCKNVNKYADISTFGEQLLLNLTNNMTKLFENGEMSRSALGFTIPLNARLIGMLPLDLININIIDDSSVSEHTTPKIKIEYETKDNRWYFVNESIDIQILKMSINNIKQSIMRHLTDILSGCKYKINIDNIKDEIQKYKYVVGSRHNFNDIKLDESNINELTSNGWTIIEYFNKQVILMSKDLPPFNLCGFNEKPFLIECSTLVTPFMKSDDECLEFYLKAHFNLKHVGFKM